MNAGALRDAFRLHFGTMPRVVDAPGRVNLIGDHTDYNQGWVLPVAIDLMTRVACAPIPGRDLRVRSTAFPGEEVAIPLRRSGAERRGHWSDYVEGVLRVLERDGIDPPAAGLLIDGDVPLGGGLASSASLAVAVARALLGLAAVRLEPEALALLCHRAEHDFVRTRCGIMDQFVACVGRAGHALFLDCRSRATTFVPLPPELEIVVVHSGIRHALADGEYNRRRARCEAAVATLAETRPSVRALRDVTVADLEQARARLGERTYRRARHVVTENGRVLECVEALRRRDGPALERLLRASHVSLRDDYEVGCAELDLLVEQAARLPGFVAARMTGGGFGGCTVNLVRAGSGAAFAHALRAAYGQETGRVSESWSVRAVSGVGVARP